MQKDSKGTWFEIENKEDLYEKIETEQARHKSSPSKDLKASRRSDEPLRTYEPIFSTMSGPAILQHHLERAATAFKDEMLYVQALSKTVWNAHGSEGDFDLVQDAAEEWLNAFDAGKAAFRLACDRLGLSTNAMVDSPLQAFVMPEQYATLLAKRMNTEHEDGTRNMTGAEHMSAMEEEADSVPLKRQDEASTIDRSASIMQETSALANPMLDMSKPSAEGGQVKASGQQDLPFQGAVALQQIDKVHARSTASYSTYAEIAPRRHKAIAIDLISDGK